MQNRNTKLVQPSSSLHLNTFAEYKKREKKLKINKKNFYNHLPLLPAFKHFHKIQKRMANTNQEMQNTMYEIQNIYNNHLHAF